MRGLWVDMCLRFRPGYGRRRSPHSGDCRRKDSGRSLIESEWPGCRCFNGRLLSFYNLQPEPIVASLMKNPVCSAVILACGGVEQLSVSLAAAVQQLGGEIEAIVTDGGSDSAVSVWLAQRKRELPALRIVETGGAGAAMARNAAIEAARAPLIAFIRASDWCGSPISSPGRPPTTRPIRKRRCHSAIICSSPRTAKASEAARIFAACAPAAARGRGFPARRRAAGGAIAMTWPAHTRNRQQGRARKGRRLLAVSMRRKTGTCGCALPQRRPLPAPRPSRPLASCVRQARLSRAPGSRMEKIVGPYEKWSAASVRNAAAKARARLDAVRADSPGPPDYAHPARATAASPHDRAAARLGKAAPPAFNEALYFVSGCRAASDRQAGSSLSSPEREEVL